MTMRLHLSKYDECQRRRRRRGMYESRAHTKRPKPVYALARIITSHSSDGEQGKNLPSSSVSVRVGCCQFALGNYNEMCTKKRISVSRNTTGFGQSTHIHVKPTVTMTITARKNDRSARAQTPTYVNTARSANDHCAICRPFTSNRAYPTLFPALVAGAVNRWQWGDDDDLERDDAVPCRKYLPRHINATVTSFRRVDPMYVTSLLSIFSQIHTIACRHLPVHR